MTELANWVSAIARCRASYNGLNGYGIEPSTIRAAIRAMAAAMAVQCSTTGGSSSGVGTAVSFWAANVGAETSRLDPEPGKPEHAGRRSNRRSGA